jgi:DNA-binding NtrC family response regulator
MESHILVIDDDKKYIKELKGALEAVGVVETGYCVEDFYNLYQPHKYDLLLIDLRLEKEYEGLELVKYAIEEDPNTPVLVITGYANIDTAIEALKNGASSYIQKDKTSINQILVKVKETLDNVRYKHIIKTLIGTEDEIVGEDDKIREAIKHAKLVGNDGKATVLIRGGTGTGKELVAKTIHQTGVRENGPFIPVAIPVLNESTVVSELFGHEKGAFTGATKRHIGYIEQAHNGILFLDEVGDLSNEAQLKLLRFLDNKKFRRMGGDKDISVDVQVVTATNQDLEELISKGRFREDLFYRLKVFEIYLPPLRERKRDIELLSNYFLTKLYENNRTTAREFSEEVLKILMEYKWPGNVRELKQVIESAALKAKMEEKETIHKGFLPDEIKGRTPKNLDDKSIHVEKILAEKELQYIEDALKKTNWRKTEAWKLLGYPNRFTIRRKVLTHFDDYPELSKEFPELFKAYH